MERNFIALAGAKFDISDEVFLRTDDYGLTRIVTGITFRQGTILYELSQGEKFSSHYDYEITTECPITFDNECD